MRYVAASTVTHRHMELLYPSRMRQGLIIVFKTSYIMHNLFKCSALTDKQDEVEFAQQYLYIQ